MPQRKAGAASLSKVRRPSAPSHSAKNDIGVSHSSPKTAGRPVSGSPVRRFTLSVVLPWTAAFLGIFGVLVIFDRPVAGLLCIAGAFVLLTLPEATS